MKRKIKYVKETTQNGTTTVELVNTDNKRFVVTQFPTASFPGAETWAEQLAWFLDTEFQRRK